MKKALVAIIVSLSASGAIADESKIAFSYSQADFESIESVKALHRRVRSIAADNCPTYSVTRDLSASQRCVDEVVENLIEAIDHPVLSAYLEGDDELQLAIDTHRTERSG